MIAKHSSGWSGPHVCMPDEVYLNKFSILKLLKAIFQSKITRKPFRLSHLHKGSFHSKKPQLLGRNKAKIQKAKGKGTMSNMASLP